MNNLFILLMPQQKGDNPMSMLIMMGLIVVVFYFFMIRPQMKKQKELKKFRDELKNGDKIITNGGIYGKVVEISDTTVIIEVEGKTRLKVHKTMIVREIEDLMQKK